MHHSFLSIIGVIQTNSQLRDLSHWLNGLYSELEAHFSDFEFILVNNHCDLDQIDAAIRPLPENLRKHIFLLQLSAPVSRDNALLAGLDRANGDYAVIFEFDFAESPQLVSALWQKSQSGFDIVYLRASERKLPWIYRQLYAIFYSILRRYSNLHIDPQAHHTRIISRRALNSMLRLRENSRYLKAIYALVGYNTTAIDVDRALLPEPGASFGDQFRTSLVAITSFTTFLRSLLLWIFLLSCLVAGTAIFNAVKVKMTNVDIFGTYHQTVSGWAYLVVVMSVFFAITCLNLYIMSIYLSNIYSEIKNRPLYIIESVRRY
ncbi:MAG: glycosyltransferase [Lewinellaceae bacterium]|nr:glycosyltransferase [Saprospiraceae bacterium]MCB9316334.1 glycosyltransferase [Lewinellaceae bacterium]MCB9330705.1 glycosyltransferase [Lewinellaceae bacterium]